MPVQEALGAVSTGARAGIPNLWEDVAHSHLLSLICTQVLHGPAVALCVQVGDWRTRLRAWGRPEGLDFRERLKGWSIRDVKVVGGKGLWSEKGSSVTKIMEVKPS